MSYVNNYLTDPFAGHQKLNNRVYWGPLGRFPETGDCRGFPCCDSLIINLKFRTLWNHRCPGLTSPPSAKRRCLTREYDQRPLSALISSTALAAVSPVTLAHLALRASSAMVTFAASIKALQESRQSMELATVVGFLISG